MKPKHPKPTRLSLLLPAKLKRQLQYEVAQGKRILGPRWSLKSEILDRLERSFSPLSEDVANAVVGRLQMDRFDQVFKDLYAENKRLREQLSGKTRGPLTDRLDQLQNLNGGQ